MYAPKTSLFWWKPRESFFIVTPIIVSIWSRSDWMLSFTPGNCTLIAIVLSSPPQFPIGLADAGGDDGGLLLSWGLRDHESCLTQVGLGTLRGMLRPL